MGRVSELLTGTDSKTRCVRVIRGDSSEGVYSISSLSECSDRSDSNDENPNVSKITITIM